ncbi:hypothetical protein H7X46_04170 [Pseudonocardia sp. C8]|uniref:hypothetical protein n=1 Tax=Pseudonocardia sp. C8 TaxID=2762759 RepID=UPI001642355B|nr:hypothetical protein [Pseudonocardia sp. C8]MBC3190257.1 hypothetical protein [Pseudonocardia sp. C8]
MNRPRRVAVTAPPEPGGRSRTPGARPVPEPVLEPGRAAQARTIRRAQLRRVAVTLTCGAVLLLGLPVLLHAVPGLTGWRVGGLPLGWILVAWVPYPLLAGLAWWHLRGAERVERDDRAARTAREDRGTPVRRNGRAAPAGQDERPGDGPGGLPAPAP